MRSQISYTLIVAGKKDIDVAKQIIVDISAGKIDLEYDYTVGDIYAELGAAHLSLARSLLDATFVNNLDGNNLSLMGAAHEEIAWLILENPHLFKRCNGDNLTLMAIEHIKIAKQIINKPELIAKCSNANKVSIGAKHEVIAKLIQEDQALFNQLDSKNYCIIYRPDMFFTPQRTTQADPNSNHNDQSFQLSF